MKAINYKKPLRTVFTYSLITAQLLSTQFIGSYAYAYRGEAPPPVTAPTEAEAAHAESTGAASSTAAASSASATPPAAAPAAQAPAPREPLRGTAIQGKPKFNVTDGDQNYVAEAEVISSESTNTQYAYVDGQYLEIKNPTTKKYSAKISLYDTEGNFICASGEECGLSAPDVTNQLHDLNSVITAALKKDLGAITKKRKDEQKKKEKEDKLLASCKAIQGSDGEIIKITSKNRMEHFEDVLDCQISRATEDKDEEKNDEDLTLAELRSKEIGGLLRRAMSDEDSEVRGQAQEAIESLENDFGDTSRNVRAYLNVLGDGAEQMDRLYDLKDQADSNPQARAQILAEMDRAVGAWNPQNFAGKTKGYTEAASDVHKLFRAISCDSLSTAMSSNRIPSSGGTTGATCDSDLDKAIGDGYSETLSRRERDEDTDRDEGGSSSSSTGFKRGVRTGGSSNTGRPSIDPISGGNSRFNRVSSTPNSGAIFNQNQRTQFQQPLANPNQYSPGNNNGTGRRFN